MAGWVSGRGVAVDWGDGQRVGDVGGGGYHRWVTGWDGVVGAWVGSRSIGRSG